MLTVISSFGYRLTWDGTRWQREKPSYDKDTGMDTATRMAVAEFKYEHMREGFAKKARLDYLRHVWRLLRANDLAFDIQAEVYAGQPIFPIIAARHAKTLDKMLAVLKEVKRINRPKPKTTEGGITPVMIARAREYPVERILAEAGIEPDRRGRYLCLYHADTDPSMTVWKNTVHCWSCDERDDSIGVSMKTTGNVFPEAVRRLAP